MTKIDKRTLLAVCASFGLALFSGAAFAGEECDPKVEKCDPPPPPPPPKTQMCHNIGGPMELGANCDGATGACTFTLEEYGPSGDPLTVTVPKDHFLGILIGASSEGAIAAHLAHGDGFVTALYEPRIHVASTGQIHKASTVDCMAKRAITTQPPEPGN
jgi:hypothetical protein